MQNTRNIWRLDLGATVIDPQSTSFKVWAPERDSVCVKIVSGKTCEIPLRRSAQGYFTGIAEGVVAGDRYIYVLDQTNSYPDPASRFQPEGVHSPSQVIDPFEHSWSDNEWKGMSWQDFIIYELHAGVFTKEGTFEAIIPLLDYLIDFGITAIELMPVAQFPGNRNWGYDGVYPFAPQNTYGGPKGLKKLIDIAHKKGLAIILDVVYNHLGPEGNYLSRYGPYFTDKYKTPWGDAVNFDGAYSDGVRDYFINNALYWISEYHIDALRLDAVHGIMDFGARHFLSELHDAVNLLAKRSGKNVFLIAESDLNDVRIINPKGIGGYGLDAQLNDDFHHSLHTLLTGEHKGYYEDFGKVENLAKALREGFVYSGEYSAFRKRRHGNSSKDCPAYKFVVFSQSHDQVGNRILGDRLSQTKSLEKLKLAAGVVFLSPYIPKIFMGEEYAEIAPFHYFIDHSDDALVKAVKEGRKKEFASYEWEGDPPDPAAQDTFNNSKLARDLRNQGKHKILFEFYRELIRLRREIASLRSLNKEAMDVGSFEEEKVLFVRRWGRREQVAAIFHFGDTAVSVNVPLPHGRWLKLLSSGDEQWNGPGSDLPAMLHSAGEVQVTLTQNAFVMLKLQTED
ncbi:MAG: malto-oligosyltrehalose trehalohydrolase [Thermodesulfovibrionales bacterium]